MILSAKTLFRQRLFHKLHLFPREGGDMKAALHLFWRSSFALLLLAVLASVAVPARGEPLTLKRAVELALTHSPLAGESGADEQRAFASMREARSQYIPQVTVGSGLGDSWG